MILIHLVLFKVMLPHYTNKETFQPEESVVSSDLHSKETNQAMTALDVQPAEFIRPT